MAKNFFQRIDTDHGPVTVHVNRRGCKGPWTEVDAAAMTDLVKAVAAMDSEALRALSDKARAPSTTEPAP